ncbi:hypothetical protein GGS21DRAFT_539099 [Xylaria nigripes]|nr:hypothetical protein GGS21DRAFT_539099 [Xylaria nigripes]
MSVFSIMKRGRAQAKEHNAKQADKEKAEAVKLPYKHIPTHAAADALATAPSSWKQDDRSRIKEQNQRRSAMAASGGNHHGLPRVGSSLAHVSYPSVYANPIVPLPKNYSYVSVSSSWREKMANTAEASEEEDCFNNPRDYKGKGREVVHSITGGTGGRASPVLSSGRTSPLSNRAEPVNVGIGVAITSGLENPSGSEGGEGEKDLRTGTVKNFSRNSDSRPSSSRDSSSTGERLHHLHPSHARNLSESRNKPERYYPPQARSTYFSAPRPTSRRAAGVDMSTTSSSVPDGQFYANHAPSSAASSVSSIGIAISTAPTSAVSTPPASTMGDIPPPTETHSAQSSTTHTAPAVVRPRPFSLSEFKRTSNDTIRPSSPESRERSQTQALSTRGRRLSKSRTQESGETQRHTSDNNHIQDSVEAVHITVSSSKTKTMVSELEQLEFKPLSKGKHTRRRLSKDRTRNEGRTEDTQTSTKHRWSFFGR